MNSKIVHMVAFILLVVGGLNWLLVGVFGFDLVAEVFGPMSTLAKVVYILVGLAALYEIFTHRGRCSECRPSSV